MTRGAPQNAGLEFDREVHVLTLTFVLKVRIYGIYERQWLFGALERVALSAAPSFDSLLTTMNGRSMLNNWGVVFNMKLDRINHVLEQQYEEFKKNNEFMGKVNVSTMLPDVPMGDVTVFNLSSFDFSYSYPKLKFLLNSDNMFELKMAIASGKVSNGKRFEAAHDKKKCLVAVAALYNKEESDINEETVSGKVIWVL